MHSVRPDIKNIATISAVVFLVLFSGWLRFSGADWEVIGKAATKSGTILTVLGLFWVFYIKVGWRLRPLRLWGWLSNVPDLQGRWEGAVRRHKDDEPHEFVIEISQTYNSISYRTFSKNSKGDSVTATILTDETGKVFKVISTWRVTTRKLEDATAEDSFTGTSIWNISFEGAVKTLEDTYYTGREPQTKGISKMKWVSRDLKNRFE